MHTRPDRDGRLTRITHTAIIQSQRKCFELGDIDTIVLDRHFLSLDMTVFINYDFTLNATLHFRRVIMERHELLTTVVGLAACISP